MATDGRTDVKANVRARSESGPRKKMVSSGNEFVHGNEIIHDLKWQSLFGDKQSEELCKCRLETNIILKGLINIQWWVSISAGVWTVNLQMKASDISRCLYGRLLLRPHAVSTNLCLSFHLIVDRRIRRGPSISNIETTVNSLFSTTAILELLAYLKKIRKEIIFWDLADNSGTTFEAFLPSHTWMHPLACCPLAIKRFARPSCPFGHALFACARCYTLRLERSRYLWDCMHRAKE